MLLVIGAGVVWFLQQKGVLPQGSSSSSSTQQSSSQPAEAPSPRGSEPQRVKASKPAAQPASKPASKPSDKLATDGVMRIESLGANKIKRIIDFSVDAKIFAVGGLFEETAEKNMRASYDVSARFMAKWIADKGLT